MAFITSVSNVDSISFIDDVIRKFGFTVTRDEYHAYRMTLRSLVDGAWVFECITDKEDLIDMTNAYLAGTLDGGVSL
jgi:hypothetical protein